MDKISTVANTFHFGRDCYIFVVPMVMMLFDYITGIMKAWHLHTISSSKLRDGLNHKAGECIIILIAVFLQKTLGIPKEITIFVSVYIIIMEIISIIENLDEIGVKIPSWVKNKLLAIVEDNENAEEKS
jgi:toxin secretion/phage lysis holin